MTLEQKLLLDLPPLAPDYSGVCSALFELGGLLIIHDASGCTGNYTGFDEPRWFGSRSAVFSSGIREMEAVMGDDGLLIEKTLAAVADLRPRFVALMGSPVPMVIGTDLDGIASEITARTGLPAFGFNTKGFDRYDRGVAEAYRQFERTFVSAGDSLPGHVNILGATPLDFGIGGAVPALREIVRAAGLRLNVCWSMGCSLEELGRSAAAALNIVVSWSGLELARRFRERFGTPYVAGFPVGSRAAERYAKTIARIPEGAEHESFRPAAAAPDILILGEQIAANSLREALEEDGACSCRVATLFELDAGLSREGDRRLDNECELRECIRDGSFAVIIGDPLFACFAPPGARFVPLPHVAVSGRLHWNQGFPLVGSGGDTLLERIRKEHNG